MSRRVGISGTKKTLDALVKVFGDMRVIDVIRILKSQT